jgi:hypothetical protein
VLTFVALLPGLTWGLPGREADAFLFGDRTPWTGEEILEHAGGFATDAAADVDRDPTRDTTLNATDAQRAAIVLRYRLYSEQPDEMLTLRAIASMAQRRSPDPQFYTYGGLWTYPAATLIGGASLLGLIERGDLAFYLDHPEEFAKMYVVLRLYATAWAAVGAAVVFVLVRRVTGSAGAATAGVLLYAMTPLVIIGSHEAKPHLPGAVLAMAATLPTLAIVRSDRRRHLLATGALAGAAAGIVVTMAVTFLLIPTAMLLRRTSLRDGGLAILVGLGVFAVTNPFVLLNPSALLANVGNTAGHYGVATGGLDSFFGWIGRTLGSLTLAVGPAAFVSIWLGVLRGRKLRPATIDGRASLTMLLVLIAASLATFFLTSFGRPADHVRFASLASLAGIVAAVVLLHTPAVRRPHLHLAHAAAMVVAVAVGAITLLPYASNARGHGHRQLAAETLSPLSGGTLVLPGDPAPYLVPPFDLWRWSATTDADAAGVRLVDPRGRWHTISWANPAQEIVVVTSNVMP